ncbi:helix-turn-helix domain-containing protein [Pengzhenrongella sp.]|jgi:AcrR family transcriptional regulator|uniref:TetR/AcrR family transcriptional regulator n=1 Tax=Pengzhenrongella sp. TaxID=2888820 RepID=UPI002F921BD4
MPDDEDRPGSGDGAPVEVGRRARNKLEKQDRIFQAASDLFAERGYSAVATQLIAERADVGTGTLFRYASSKAELLMMVMNEKMRLDTRRGVAAAASADSPTEAILALLGPQIEASRQSPENTAVYQREILFGTEQGEYRLEALARISELEDAIGDILERFARASRVRDGVDLRGAARTTFSTLHMELIRVSLGREDPGTLGATLRSHVDALLYGVLAPA